MSNELITKDLEEASKFFEESTNIWHLTQFLSGVITDRKLRLTCLEFLKRIPHLPINNVTIKSSFQMVEDYAERRAPQNILKQAQTTIEFFKWKIQREYIYCAETDRAVKKLQSRFWAACRIHSDPGHDILRCMDQDHMDSPRAEDCNIIRHMVRNPFLQLDEITVSSNTKQLATACYEQNLCNFALHDSLLEEGKDQFAGHFLEPVHPKGCWVLDYLLGKE